MQNVSILFPLGRGSRWQDNELRYSLRSIEKHLKGYGEIFIVGEKPEWLQHVIHIPCKDLAGTGIRDYNIYRKIMAGIDDTRLTDDFLFFNDDHFLLQGFEASEFPFYHSGFLDGTIESYTDRYPYRKVLMNTIQYLNNIKGLTRYDFDLHCPILYNKKAFAASLPDKFPVHGYAIKSMYGNLNKIDGVYCKDLKFKEKQSMLEIVSALESRPWFSIGNKCLKGAVPEVLELLYPNKSKYEL